MVNTPIPTSLKSEAKKAAKILRDFTIPSTKVGPDKLIPAGLVSNAQGLCILTVVKVGFLVTARGGSGIVIAKDRDGNWSPPSAIGIAGLGGGFEIGAEVTDFVIVLNKRAAVQAFSKGGNLTLGGNITIAAGPMGRNIEADVSLRSTAAIYTYSHTKGLFAGISIEGSGLIERKDANKNFYGRPIRAYEILDGQVDRPPECSDLYEVLDRHEEMFRKAALAYAKRQAVSEAKKAAAGGSAGILARVKSLRSSTRSGGNSSRSGGNSSGNSRKSSRDSMHSETAASTWYTGTEQECVSSSDDDDVQTSRGTYNAPLPRSRSNIGFGAKQEESKMSARCRSSGNVQNESNQQRAITKSERSDSKLKSCSTSSIPESPWDKKPMARALWDYAGQMACDLTFKEGDEIEIMMRTGRQDDWWEGKLNGRLGIFPANYVEVLSMC